MQIQCPHCEKENNLNLEKEVVCGECKESLSGSFLYVSAAKKPIIGAAAALFIGYFGHKTVDHIISVNRFPLEVEYSMLNTCINSDTNIISSKLYLRKKEVCLCSLDKTLEDVNYSDLKDDSKMVADVFREKMATCRK